MESIDEVVIVSVKRQCSSCNVVKDDDQFVTCVANCAFFKTCQSCRDHKKKYRDKVKASKVKVVDDAISVSSSTTPADYFGPVPPDAFFTVDYDVNSPQPPDDLFGLCPPPPGIGL